jgi:hypothetical protein
VVAVLRVSLGQDVCGCSPGRFARAARLWLQSCAFRSGRTFVAAVLCVALGKTRPGISIFNINLAVELRSGFIGFFHYHTAKVRRNNAHRAATGRPKTQHKQPNCTQHKTRMVMPAQGRGRGKPSPQGLGKKGWFFKRFTHTLAQRAGGTTTSWTFSAGWLLRSFDSFDSYDGRQGFILSNDKIV